jgi:hypothetical protein
MGLKQKLHLHLYHKNSPHQSRHLHTLIPSVETDNLLVIFTYLLVFDIIWNGLPMLNLDFIFLIGINWDIENTW